MGSKSSKRIYIYYGSNANKKNKKITQATYKIIVCQQ